MRQIVIFIFMLTVLQSCATLHREQVTTMSIPADLLAFLNRSNLFFNSDYYWVKTIPGDSKFELGIVIPT